MQQIERDEGLVREVEREKAKSEKKSINFNNSLCCYYCYYYLSRDKNIFTLF